MPRAARVRTTAFVIGVLIAGVGLVGLVAPPALYGIAGWFTNAGPWYVLAAARIAIGVLLFRASGDSRAPRAVRVVAFVPILAGLAIPIIGVGRAGAMVSWWTSLNPGVSRLSVLPVFVLGTFVAWAFAPPRASR